MNKNALLRLLCLAVALFLVVPGAVAQDLPPKLAELWLVSPKEGHAEEFYAGIRAHMAFRQEQGDPRAWQSYTPLLGEDLRGVGVRYCCFEWVDADDYRKWEADHPQVQAHFDEHVAPHIASAAHYFESIDWANSHWSEAGGPYRLFAVTEFQVDPANSSAFDQVRAKLSQIAIQNGWATDDHSWVWASTIGGEPAQAIIIPHRNFASLDGKRPSFGEFLAERMGSPERAAELMQSLMSTVSSIDYQIWELQPELSMPEND